MTHTILSSSIWRLHSLVLYVDPSADPVICQKNPIALYLSLYRFTLPFCHTLPRISAFLIHLTFMFIVRLRGLLLTDK
jgi:hypothetical protein